MPHRYIIEISLPASFPKDLLRTKSPAEFIYTVLIKLFCEVNEILTRCLIASNWGSQFSKQNINII